MRRLGLAFSTVTLTALLAAVPAAADPLSQGPAATDPVPTEPAPAGAPQADPEPSTGVPPQGQPTGTAPRPTCPGFHIGTYRVQGRYARGLVHLYYSRANGGTNCAWFQRLNNPGRRIWMYVHLMRCPLGARPGGVCRPDRSSYDAGYYRYYAGPVRVTGTARHCIRLTAGDAGGTALYTRNHHCR